MGRPTNATLRARPEEPYRFLTRALFRLESVTVAVLLLITLARPAASLVVGLPSWGLVLLFAVYTLLANLVQNRLRSLRSLAWRYVVDLPMIALIYLLGGEEVEGEKFQPGRLVFPRKTSLPGNSLNKCH